VDQFSCVFAAPEVVVSVPIEEGHGWEYDVLDQYAQDVSVQRRTTCTCGAPRVITFLNIVSTLWFAKNNSSLSLLNFNGPIF
jgi:hypothetical protein